jgi:hypothetical protein
MDSVSAPVNPSRFTADRRTYTPNKVIPHIHRIHAVQLQGLGSPVSPGCICKGSLQLEPKCSVVLSPPKSHRWRTPGWRRDYPSRLFLFVGLIDDYFRWRVGRSAKENLAKIQSEDNPRIEVLSCHPDTYYSCFRVSVGIRERAFRLGIGQRNVC